MLTKENNARLCEVGPGTPMGMLLRRFWVPALLSSELPAGSREPVRVTLFGESFVAFRDASGEVGFLDEFCPHRGASLALGRCESDGIRCLYHGWKFSVSGELLETPNFNSNQTFRDQVKAPTFPCVEAIGMIWVYLGPADKEPPFPKFPFSDAPDDQFAVARVEIPANWVQIMEGHHDSSHASYLHQDFTLFGEDVSEDQVSVLRGDVDFVSDDITPDIEIETTDFGFYEGALRSSSDDDGRDYARIHAFVMPFLSLVPPKNYIWEIPMDDTTTSTYILSYDPDGLDKDAFKDLFITQPGRYLAEGERRFNPTPENHWFQDRSVMDISFSGIASIFVEDVAVCASMGPIIDRTKEHLVKSDVAVAHLRRRLLEATHDLEKGIEPPEARVDLSEVVPVDGLVRENESWRSLLPHADRQAQDMPA